MELAGAERVLHPVGGGVPGKGEGGGDGGGLLAHVLREGRGRGRGHAGGTRCKRSQQQRENAAFTTTLPPDQAPLWSEACPLVLPCCPSCIAHQAVYAASAPADLVLIPQHAPQVRSRQPQLVARLAVVLALPVLCKLEVPGGGGHLQQRAGDGECVQRLRTERVRSRSCCMSSNGQTQEGTASHSSNTAPHSTIIARQRTSWRYSRRPWKASLACRVGRARSMQ